MSSHSKELSAKSRSILSLIAQGYSYQQILDIYPVFTYIDIFEAAKEALDVISSRVDISKENSPIDEIRKKHPRAYEKWNDEEDQRLTKLFQSGAGTKEIAYILQRQPGAITSRLSKLGLIEER